MSLARLGDNVGAEVHVVRSLLGFLLACLLNVWVRTLRVKWVGKHRLEHAAESPRVFAFWHGQQMALLAARPRWPIVTLVSWSRDGVVQASVMRTLGFDVVRGSSSRGGAAGLRGVLRAVEAGADAALAVDGPRGPARHVKPGALALARRTGARLLPVASAANRALVLGAWDAFELPLPFSTVAVAIGPAFEALGPGTDPGALAAAIEAARLQALRALGPGARAGSKRLPLPTSRTKRAP